MTPFALALAVAAAAAPLARAGVYPIAESMAGDNFLQGWNWPDSFYDNTTSGEVFWYGTAEWNNSQPLIYKTARNTTIMKVDDTSTVVANPWHTTKRFAPRLLSKRAYGVGTVWVLDAIHMPYGCSVWPAFWTVGPDWPVGGEIDIMEGIHHQAVNQMALHSAEDGCYAPQTNQALMTGNWGSHNCSIGYSYGSGCTARDTDPASYGAAFAAAGGGVYVAEWAADAIKIWFISRPNVPAALTANAKTIDTSILGTPTGYWGNKDCTFTRYFGPQTMILQTTLCGVWAGLASTLASNGCPAYPSGEDCYTTYVHGDGSNYRTAYYEINYVNIFSAEVSTTPGVEGGLPADGPVAGNNNLGRQQTTAVTSSIMTKSDGATSLVPVTVTQNIPDVSAAPTAAQSARSRAESLVGSAFAFAAFASIVAALL
ncbi:hypothetical protein CC85DRAFT_327747 [Cutaneotrichosporon oleaginosum]|uniref:GH16 domain-containing protein n=1 Tax=Cutaneotrichosporon oleaginosum TaxID=879819 RepID=A0A0J0XPM1_9TREE|nr:uncharacterized protein CC85DRAFT_327747 [Cutaneotrichosporon oleaginosum]KLT43048.1 hypothetical protein CC85DRAFT_327747 [Cutaneotrichosporon oleaginosum]TXT11751.1 hypothetical protein COLE_02161 [Cutaneotrichosporon oleaginosum]